MQPFNLKELVSVVRLSEWIHKDPSFATSPGQRKSFSEALADFAGTCVTFDLRCCLSTSKKITLEMQSDVPNEPRLSVLMEELSERINDEMEYTFVVHFNSQEVGLLTNPDHLFADHAKAVFASAKGDMEEAGRCLGFQRGTASVFHVMRVVEVGIDRLSEHLECPINDKKNRSWGILIREIKTAIDARYPERDRSVERVRNGYLEIHSTLLAIKETYRDPTTHVTGNFQPPDALLILANTAKFLNKVAEIVSPPAADAAAAPLA